MPENREGEAWPGEAPGQDAPMAVRHMWRAVALAQDPYSSWRAIHDELMDATAHAGMAAAEEDQWTV